MPRVANEFAPTVLLLLPLSLYADYQAGLDAYSHADYATAMTEWRAVTDGPPTAVNPAVFVESHYAVAMLYWQGQGVAQDYAAAKEWLLKAARMNHAGAQAKLGYLYTDGKAVAQDFDQAFEWFSKAARGGNVDGLYNLGIFYLYGWGVEQNPTMAAQYLAAASALGDPEAEEALQQVLAQIEAGVTARVPQLEALPAIDEATAQESVETETLPEILDEDWIRAQDPEHFTIQVMALRSRETVIRFTEDYAAFAPFAVFTVQKSQSPLHVMLQGSYADVESARLAKERFPPAIQRQDALWIRRFGMVQRLLE